MTATVPFSYIAAEIERNGLNYWLIRQAPKGQVLAIQDDPINTEESLNLLTERLKEITGAVKVSASDVNAADRRLIGIKKHTTRTFIIDTTQTPVTGYNMQKETTYHTPKYENLQHEILTLEREKLQFKYALEHLEDKYNALEKKYNALLADNETEGDETIAGISPKVIETVLINWLTNGITPNTPTPAPPINGTPIESWNEYQKVEPDAEKVIIAILNVIKKDPGTYQMIKKTLLSNY